MLSSLRRSCPQSKNNRSVRWRRLPIRSRLPGAAIWVGSPVIMRSWRRSNCSTLLKSVCPRLRGTGALRSFNSIERLAAFGILMTRNGRMGGSGPESKPSDGVIYKQNGQRADNRRIETVEVESVYTGGAEGVERPAARHGADDSQQDVGQNALPS